MPSTIRNVVLIALTQLTVIVFTVLGAAAAWRIAADSQVGVPTLTINTAAAGSFGLFLPALWVAVCIATLRRAQTDWARALAYWSGPLLVVLLVVFGWAAAVRPILWSLFPSVGGSTGSLD